MKKAYPIVKIRTPKTLLICTIADIVKDQVKITVYAGNFGGYGYCVDIDHQNGQMTRYGHLSSILVSVGDEVYEGQHIAESGNTGASTGAHLHFEIHVNGQTHDPLQDLP